MDPIYLLDVIGAVGDSLCSEPVVRYAIRNMPGADIRIMTNYPRLFKHLGKPMGLTPEELQIDPSKRQVVHVFNRHEMLMENGKVGYHPIVTQVSPHLIHSMDFISLLMLKRIMPDADKRITIEFEDTSAKLVEMVNGPLEDLVLLHTGTGAPEPTRLFPERYCAEMITQLQSRGLKIAVIATANDGRASFTPASGGAIDLVNKLNWDDFCTIISKAKVLITNDSSPLHLASMFDNWLIALPTVKHPDRLIHPRKGHRYHKAIALYQKLMCNDAVDIPFDRYLVKCDWGTVNDKREEFLPLPDVVARCAAACFEGGLPLIGGINPPWLG